MYASAFNITESFIALYVRKTPKGKSIKELNHIPTQCTQTPSRVILYPTLSKI